MILDIPYYTQYSAKDPFWKEKSCGMTCLKMVLDYYAVNAPDLDDLIESGKDEGRIDGVGWKHDYLVKKASDYGLSGSHRKEFKDSSQNMDEAILEHIDSLKKENPVIISVEKDFRGKDDTHLIVLIGYREDENGKIIGFYYHEPDSLNPAEDGNQQFVDMESFKKHWRKMSIFLSR